MCVCVVLMLLITIVSQAVFMFSNAVDIAGQNGTKYVSKVLYYPFGSRRWEYTFVMFVCEFLILVSLYWVVLHWKAKRNISEFMVSRDYVDMLFFIMVNLKHR